MLREMWWVEECTPEGEPTGQEVWRAHLRDRAERMAQKMADESGRIMIVNWDLWEITRRGRETIESLGNVASFEPRKEEAHAN